MLRVRRLTVRVAGATLASAIALTGCGLMDKADPSGSPEPEVIPADATVITMAVWGGFGLDELIAEYEELHPNVFITLQTGDYNPLHTTLQNALVSGHDAPTIAAIGEDYIAQFAAQPEQFVDLGALGAKDNERSYLPWKWAQGTSPDGTLIGLGADASGLALCYRGDLFEEAGLPRAREVVTVEMNDSWEGFIEFGKKYEKATGKPFMDDATTLLPAVRAQLGASYYNAQGQVSIDSAKPAFEVAVNAIDADLSAGITQFSPEWDQGLASDAFAVTLCPVWGMGYMQGVLDESTAEPKWDVADIPGPGGSRGGAFYTIPAQGSPEEQAAAWEFLKWLMDPAQQLRVFQATGSLPSQPVLYADPSVTEYTIPFFNDAPVGPLLAKAVTELPVTHAQNPKTGTVEATISQVLLEVQSGGIESDDAWSVAKEAAALADGSTVTSPSPSPSAGA